jgi:hypothetical protein
MQAGELTGAPVEKSEGLPTDVHQQLEGILKVGTLSLPLMMCHAQLQVHTGAEELIRRANPGSLLSIHDHVHFICIGQKDQ